MVDNSKECFHIDSEPALSASDYFDLDSVPAPSTSDRLLPRVGNRPGASGRIPRPRWSDRYWFRTREPTIQTEEEGEEESRPKDCLKGHVAIAVAVAASRCGRPSPNRLFCPQTAQTEERHRMLIHPFLDDT